MSAPGSKSAANRQARGSPICFQLDLQRNLEAPAIARAAVTGRCQDCDLSAVLRQALVLLVSELVSNAVLHSRGPSDAPIILTAEASADAIRITVTDAGRGFIPQARDRPGVDGGYGLYVVDRAASQWGVDRVGGTRVWFELARSS